MQAQHLLLLLLLLLIPLLLLLLIPLLLLTLPLLLLPLLLLLLLLLRLQSGLQACAMRRVDQLLVRDASTAVGLPARLGVRLERLLSLQRLELHPLRLCRHLRRFCEPNPAGLENQVRFNPNQHVRSGNEAENIHI